MGRPFVHHLINDLWHAYSGASILPPPNACTMTSIKGFGHPEWFSPIHSSAGKSRILHFNCHQKVRIPKWKVPKYHGNQNVLKIVEEMCFSHENNKSEWERIKHLGSCASGLVVDHLRGTRRHTWPYSKSGTSGRHWKTSKWFSGRRISCRDIGGSDATSRQNQRRLICGDTVIAISSNSIWQCCCNEWRRVS